MSDEELRQDRLQSFHLDARFREHHKIDFDKCTKLYEARSDETDKDGIPRVNMIRRAVEDNVSVATTNIPKARLIADRNLQDDKLSPMARDLQLEAIEQMEESANDFVQTVLMDNEYSDKVEVAVRQAAIYGVGYLMIDVDHSADTRFSLELRNLLEKGPDSWTVRDVERFKVLSSRIQINHVDSRDVFWMQGVRRVDDKMLRVSIVTKHDTGSLRKIYNNPKIHAGQLPYYVDEDTTGTGHITGVLTTWELEPIPASYSIEIGGSFVSFDVTDWVMTKTVIAGGQLVERDHLTSSDTALRLPVIPFYLRESENHPYGFALPLMLELSERFINRVRTLIYQSALHAISPQAVIGYVPGLGVDDEKKISEVLHKGGFANIVGNDPQGRFNIQEVIQPIITNNPGLSAALVEAMMNEERVFQAQSQTLDLSQVARAESGSAKRAQIAVADRPKTITLGLLSRSVEAVYDTIYEHMRVIYKGVTAPATVRSSGGARQSVMFNQQVHETVPLLDETGEAVLNPETGEPEMEEIDIVVNDTSILMKAEAEGRTSFPLDLPSKLVIISQLHGMGLFKSMETLRDVLLDDGLRAKDDLYASREAQQLAAASGDDPSLSALSALDEMGPPAADQGLDPNMAAGDPRSVIPNDVLNDQLSTVRDQVLNP